MWPAGNHTFNTEEVRGNNMIETPWIHNHSPPEQIPCDETSFPGAAVNVDQPFLTRHAAIVFALKTFAAAMLALIIAVWLDLPRPYWAMTTVYITSQPLAGATSSKAFYRVLGTLIGASATVAMLPNFVDAPELLSLVIALWSGFACMFRCSTARRAAMYSCWLDIRRPLSASRRFRNRPASSTRRWQEPRRSASA